MSGVLRVDGGTRADILLLCYIGNVYYLPVVCNSFEQMEQMEQMEQIEGK